MNVIAHDVVYRIFHQLEIQSEEIQKNGGEYIMNRNILLECFIKGKSHTFTGKFWRDIVNMGKHKLDRSLGGVIKIKSGPKKHYFTKNLFEEPGLMNGWRCNTCQKDLDYNDIIAHNDKSHTIASKIVTGYVGNPKYLLRAVFAFEVDLDLVKLNGFDLSQNIFSQEGMKIEYDLHKELLRLNGKIVEDIKSPDKKTITRLDDLTTKMDMLIDHVKTGQLRNIL